MRHLLSILGILLLLLGLTACQTTGGGSSDDPAPATFNGEQIGGSPASEEPRKGIFSFLRGGKDKRDDTPKAGATDKDGLSLTEMEKGVKTLETIRVEEYAIAKGDALIIHITGVPAKDEKTVEDVVDAGGNITLPLIGEMKAIGLSSRQLESAIIKAYSPDYYKRINITVLVPAKSYYVQGKVNQPGKYPLRGKVTLLQAIAEAGGPSEFAHPKIVYIYRNQQRFRFDRRQIEERPSLNVEVKPGDIVKIPEWIF